MPRRVVPLLAGLALLASASAGADAPLISADTSRIGHIDLYVGDVEGSHARFFEVVGGHRVPVGEVTVDRPTAVELPDSLTWSCTRRTRRFAADVTHPDGSTATARYVVRTPGCADRLVVAAPRRASPGARVAVTITDRWGLGDVAPRLCVRSPTKHRTCRTVRFATGGATAATEQVTLTRDGHWTLDVALAGTHVRRSLAAGVPAAPGATARPAMLVTGDSTVQGIDAWLGDRLRRSFRVVSDFRPGSGIGHDEDRWPAFARREAARVAPAVTVLSIGAMEGFPMRLADGTSVACCRAEWQAEYARRTRGVMTALVRGGRARLLWLTLPTPEDPRRAAISAAVNAVAEWTAADVPGVTVVRVDRVLSPGWTFRRTLRYRGSTRVVRTPDGIHLTPAGAAIATDLVLRALSRPR